MNICTFQIFLAVDCSCYETSDQNAVIFVFRRKSFVKSMAQSATSLSWELHTLADVSSSRCLPQMLRARVFLWWEGFLLWLMALAKQRMRKIHSACHLLWHGTEAELKTGLSLSIWSVIFTRILVVENNSIVETEITQIITSLYMRFFYSWICASFLR